MRFEPAKDIEWNQELLDRFWAHYSQFPEFYFSFQHGAAVVAKVRRRTGAGARVLDYGCGPGHLLVHLLDAGYSVTGAELSTDTMGQAREKVAGRAGFDGLYTVADLIARGEKFDAVFLLEVIEHLDDRWLDETLANIRNLLAPGGTLIVTTPNEERLEDNMVYCPVSNVVFHRWQHVRNWSLQTLEACLRRHGYGQVDVEACTFPDPAETAMPLVRRLASRVRTRLRRPQSLMAMARL